MLKERLHPHLDWLLALYVVLREHNRLCGRGVDAVAKIEKHLLSVIAQSSRLQNASAQRLALQLLRLVAASVDRELISAYVELVLQNRAGVAWQDSGLLEMICRVIEMACHVRASANLELNFALELGRQWIPAEERPSPDALSWKCREAWNRHLGILRCSNSEHRFDPGGAIEHFFQVQTMLN